MRQSDLPEDAVAQLEVVGRADVARMRDVDGDDLLDGCRARAHDDDAVGELDGLVDIVAAGLDAGVRSGDILARDMVAVPIGPDLRMVVVATPAFCGGRELPRHPRDLAAHPCINFRLPTRGGIYAWEFSRGGDALRMRVEGPVTVNTLALAEQAMRDDLGFAFLPESVVAADIAAGRLVQVLDDWCEPYPGYHLYYPSRAHVSPALRVVIDGLRWRGEGSGDQA